MGADNDHGLVICDGCGYSNDDSYDWVDTDDGKVACGAGCLDKLERDRQASMAEVFDSATTALLCEDCGHEHTTEEPCGDAERSVDRDGVARHD